MSDLAYAIRTPRYTLFFNRVTLETVVLDDGDHLLTATAMQATDDAVVTVLACTELMPSSMVPPDVDSDFALLVMQSHLMMRGWSVVSEEVGDL